MRALRGNGVQDSNLTGGCYKFNYATQTLHVKVLASQTSECDLIWRFSLYRNNQVKMESLGRALKQYDWYPYTKKGNLGPKTHKE